MANRPGGHWLHDAAPSCTENVPGRQAWQDDWPGWSWNSPARQGAQADLPVELAIVPGVQAEHAVADGAPLTLPVGHGSHRPEAG